MTKLERVYILGLAKKLERTDTIFKNYTSSDLKKYFEKHLRNETAGGIIKIPSKDFIEAMEIAGFKVQQVIKGSPNYYFNVSVQSVNRLFGSIM